MIRDEPTACQLSSATKQHINKSNSSHASPSSVKAPAQLSLSSASYPPADLNDIELDVQEEFERDKDGREFIFSPVGEGMAILRHD
jgi:hypothetical protein